ncbi:MAG: hypothetical protein ABIP89_10125, partial [Polyangiaceae bacterium]
IGVGGEFGFRQPFWKGAVALGLRAAYEHHGDSQVRDVPCTTSSPAKSPCRGGAARYGAKTSSNALVLGLPASYRFRKIGAPWFPYVTVSPQLIVERATEAQSDSYGSTGRIVPGSTADDWAARAAVSGALGIQVGDAGGLFLEAGFRVATPHVVQTGSASFDGVFGTLGYRFGI